MGLWDKLTNEFVDIVEWTEPPQSDILAYRFPRYQNEIKNGAQLTVREGQAAVFVNEGQIADVFKPGMYRLTTENLPILATLKGWKYGFNSPFKAEVYFISTRQFTDQKWGTANPIMMRDPEFGVVRLRAFGSFAFHVSDPATFLRQLVATDPSFDTYEVSSQLRNTIVSRFTDAVGQAKIPVLDLAGNYAKVATALQAVIAPDLATLGLALTLFYIENISLPPEVEAALDTKTKMGVLGGPGGDLSQYTRYQSAQAITEAAQNPGGIAGIGAGFGAGAAIANQMSGALNTTVTAPPPIPGATQFFIALNGQQAGPFDLAGLAAKVKDTSLTRDTLVWKNGMAQWTAAGTLPELSSLFVAVPPPLSH